MGLYLRKFLRLGPIRFNLSKSGIGASPGVKGFRVGMRPTGMFRGDLYDRLNVVPIRLPLLRERKEDIPILIEKQTERLKEEMGLDHVPSIDQHTLVDLVRYPWPGNVRELKNVLERALVLGDSVRFDLSRWFAEREAANHLKKHDKQKSNERGLLGHWTWETGFPEDRSYNDVVADLKRSLIVEGLRHAGGNKTGAARLLGLSRSALNRQMKTLGFDRT